VLGEQLLNLLATGGAGTIKTVVKVSDRVEEIASLAKRLDVDHVVEVPAGAKGNWDPAINTGTTGSLTPKTAYVLDNGHTSPVS
jgi:filamentous hemagglutinin